ncbi:MAG: hypothetical protein SFZ03_03185 [Candidatus Melainabacteria bacterium]|nr:hypothetical protein [Candidatus Melainabacteria bacterium]
MKALIAESMSSSQAIGFAEVVIRGLTMLVGSFISPVWRLMEATLSPYLSIEALRRGDPSFFIDYLNLVIRMRQDSELATEILLPLLGCLLLSGLFLYGCSKAGGWLAGRFRHACLQHQQLRRIPSTETPEPEFSI